MAVLGVVVTTFHCATAAEYTALTAMLATKGFNLLTGATPAGYFHVQVDASERTISVLGKAALTVNGWKNSMWEA